MHAENLAFNDCSNSEVVENFCAVLPWVCVSVFPDSFVIEAIHRRSLSRFVITSQESDAVGPLKLKAHQVLESFN